MTGIAVIKQFKKHLFGTKNITVLEDTFSLFKNLFSLIIN